MNWKDMHWEKIPWTIAGKDVWREQIEEAIKQDIPLRIVRLKTERWTGSTILGKSL